MDILRVEPAVVAGAFRVGQALRKSRKRGRRRDESCRGRALAGLSLVGIGDGRVRRRGERIVLVWQMPPRAMPANAPADVFSAARAMRHVEVIARNPHPLGSAAEEPVRAYIIAELKAMGFEPEIQQPRDARALGPESESRWSKRDVRNIVARWRGSGPAGKKALLLSAHYDSDRFVPGAGDDASGVAAILESLRAMKAGPGPRNAT